MTSAVQVKLTTTEYQDPAFGWYELYADQTALALGSVVASASFNEIEFSNTFIHAALTPGDTWHYWVRAAYLDRTTGAITYGTLASLGSILITGGGGSPYIVGPGSAVDSHFIQFDGTSGLLAKDGGLSFDTDAALAANSNSRVPSQAAVKSYASNASNLSSGTVAIGRLPVDTDGTLAANSDSLIATQKAVKTYADSVATAAQVYTDNKVAGLSWKQEVRAATTGPGTLASSFENGDTIDGVTLATNDRILIKDQASGAENGIYKVNASGAPTRTTDADSGAELVNATVYVSEGTANQDTQWTCSTNAPITPNTTPLSFSQMSSGAIPTAASTTEQLTGTDAAKFATPDSVAALWEKGANVASASTTTLGEGGFFHITGTVTITALAFSVDKAGRKAWLSFDGVLTLTYNGTSLILPTGASIVTQANDRALFVSEGSGNFRCLSYLRADGTPLASGAGITTNQATEKLTFIFDGGASALTSGLEELIYVGFNCTIVGWVIFGDLSGSCTFDLQNDSYTNYPPTGADSIVASDPPTSTTSTKAKFAHLTGWTTSIAADSFLRAYLSSTATYKKLRLVVLVQKT